jgi:hypothetical protein
MRQSHCRVETISSSLERSQGSDSNSPWHVTSLDSNAFLRKRGGKMIHFACEMQGLGSLVGYGHQPAGELSRV